MSMIFENGSEIVVDSPDPVKSKVARKKIVFSKIALGFIVVGFLFQLIGNFII